ncbi:MT-A70 family methyltransferase [Phenylobacterium sp.]|uniref:MT-A70 family methyltransferase n=1 Tax=Phenylobacterium sp. TaxID=1871053 RepID=UPI0019952986|nr:MT-A70 family methyltransferase [Phenylobacterium sp.]MBC7169243.1 DNA methyltransferase [Phenylobacterium sp.]
MSDLLHTPQAGRYSVIYADPAWRHQARSPKGVTRRAPARHYRTMPLADICALPVREVAAKDCHLFLWTTGPHLQQAFAVMEAWGFRYSSIGFLWAKLNPGAAGSIFLTESDWHVGMGYTTRKNTEICLLGRRGAPKRKSKSVRELIVAARREHSRKPDQARQRIEAYAEGPYLEMFARESAAGWDAWGLETGKFDSDPTRPVAAQDAAGEGA